MKHQIIYQRGKIMLQLKKYALVFALITGLFFIYNQTAQTQSLRMPPPIIGAYPSSNVITSGNIVVTPNSSPVDATKISVSTNSRFKGTFTANPTTGVVRVTNAYPAGSYTVKVKAFNFSGSTERTFSLVVRSGPACTGPLQFRSAPNIPINEPNIEASQGEVAVGDFNNDGRQDLATLGDNVCIYGGNGLGGFPLLGCASATFTSDSDAPRNISVGDFNNDGNLDFVTSNVEGHDSFLYVRLGNGTGAFPVAISVPVRQGIGNGRYFQEIVVGDFNNDGNLDLAAASVAGFPHVMLRLGDGTGHFPVVRDIEFSDGPNDITTGDFNNDGNQDIATANFFGDQGASTISIRLGNGAGGFSTSVVRNFPARASDITSGDFNNDGNQDLAVSNWENVVGFFYGNGAGNFLAPAIYTQGNDTLARHLTNADFNNDGWQDVIYSDLSGYYVFILQNNRQGQFNDRVFVNIGDDIITTSRNVAVGDFNGDGKQDFISVDNNFFRDDTYAVRLGNCSTATVTSSVAGTISYGNTSAGQPVRPIVDVNVSATGGSSVSAVTNSSGDYVLNGLINGANYTVTPSKTATDFSGINSLDAARILQHLNGSIVLTPNQLIAADTDGNGIVNLTDATRIQEKLVGKQTSNVLGQWKFAPVNRQYNQLSGNQTGQNYQAMLTGEVSGNWSSTNNFANAEEERLFQPNDQANIIEKIESELIKENTAKTNRSVVTTPNESSKEAAFMDSPVQVSLPLNATGTTGSTVTIPITIGAIPAGSPIESFDFSVIYDSNILQPAALAGSNSGTLSSNCSVLPHARAPHMVSVSGACAQAITTGSGVLYNLKFNVTGSANQQTAIVFPNFFGVILFGFNNGAPPVNTTDGQFTVTAAAPDLTVAKTHTGNFAQGDTGKTYSITVTNSGSGATSGTISVADSLPAGLTATNISGTGWSCNFSNLTCTRSDALAGNSSYPAITLTVNVAANAPATVTNQVSVSGGGETNTGNNSASDQTTINAATPPGNGTGLRGDYYNTINLTGAVIFSRIDPTINFEWSGSPGPGVGSDNFSVRWSGQIEPAYTETYTLYTTSDDGVRLWIGGVLIIDNWTNHAPIENSATVTLNAGQRYDIRMEFFDAAGGAVARLAWSSPSRSKQVVPSDRLYQPRYSLSGSARYGITEPGQPSSIVTGTKLNVTGAASAEVFTDNFGNYYVSNLPGGNYTVTPSKTGDIKGINTVDATRIQQHLVGITTLSANQLIAADTDGSGSVNSLDATRIQQRVVGIQTPNIIGLWKFVPGSRQHNLNSDLSGQSYEAILVGEVSGNWATSFAENFQNEEENEILLETDDQNQIAERFADDLLVQTAENVSRSSDSLLNQTPTELLGPAADIQVSLPTDAVRSNGSTVTIPITVGAIPAGLPIESFDFWVFYNTAILQPAAIAGSNTGTLSANCSVLPNSPVAGRVIVSGACAQALTTGSGVLYNLTFNVIGAANQTSSLSFTNPANNTNTFQFNNGSPMVGTTNGQFTALGPTAASVSVSGRVITSDGRGLINASVVLTDASGTTRTTRTGTFGYFRFDSVEAGKTYIFNVSSKRYSFAPQMITVIEDVTELNFTAQ